MLKTDDIRRIVNTVCRRARRQGFIIPQEVRDELAGAGLLEARWLEVVSLAGYMLTKRDGCYYYSPTAVTSRREERRQRRLDRAVRQLIRGYKSSYRQERRQRGRIDFIQPVLVETEDGRSFTLLSSDLSVTGIRLIGPSSLLGQKIRVTLPTTEGAKHRCFSVQIVWSGVVGEGLCENGGAFLGIADPVPLPILGPCPGGNGPSLVIQQRGLGSPIGQCLQPRAR